MRPCAPPPPPNKVLLGPPLEVDPSERLLPRPYRSTLSQLRSGYCSRLQSYLHRVGRAPSPACPDCGDVPHTTEHLFSCPVSPTDLAPADLWTASLQAALFISSTPSLMNQFTKHPIAQRLRFTLFDLIKNGKKVKFCWIPSHRGIPGNEAVDSKAKTATSRDPEWIPIYYRDYYSLVQKKIHQKWATMWSQSGDKLREIVPVPHPITYSQQYVQKTGSNTKQNNNRPHTADTRLSHGLLQS